MSSVVVMERLPLGVALAPGKVCAQQARLGNIQAKRAAIMRHSSVALAGAVSGRAHQPRRLVMLPGRADIMRHSRGVSQLKPDTVKRIQENIGNLSMIFDFDGTLVAAGAGLGEKDGQLMRCLVNVLEGAVGINTAQAPEYMADRGGSIFPAKAFELGHPKVQLERLRVEHMDGTDHQIVPNL
ncbi:hypothetical protein AXG93_2415s1700 [Marchantia polymorpha subsp. ruderalis]|uniref:Uncharacterized protein n=1 Tax=Marchantia polymorpha subsp. ruderalis TaxID=1480154 RepID=A0A176VV01_MARPO|nr:hypothetical protein AXG93_2415s1700 [Marchantia polymorpha subsp. ruderalis]